MLRLAARENIVDVFNYVNYMRLSRYNLVENQVKKLSFFINRLKEITTINDEQFHIIMKSMDLSNELMMGVCWASNRHTVKASVKYVTKK